MDDLMEEYEYQVGEAIGMSMSDGVLITPEIVRRAKDQARKWYQWEKLRRELMGENQNNENDK